jgi:retinol dehydrogenase-12
MIEIKEETGHKNTELYILDLANFASVKAFAQRFTQEESRLDILVENAGVVPDPNFPVTEDGWEPTSVHFLSSTVT